MGDSKADNYREFLTSKMLRVSDSGFTVKRESLNSKLFPFQAAITQWAIRKGRCAIFADTGLGKTPMQLEWCQKIIEHTGHKALIVAPLSVSRQTARLGAGFGYGVNPCRTQADVQDGINITNYEMLEHFDPSQFGMVVYDESSIFKAIDSVTRRKVMEMFADTPYRLCCTATPAPNDIVEIGNHAEVLGVLKRKEVEGMFFVKDEAHGSGSNKWRLKGHAQEKFYQWLASWAMSIRKPSDLGFENDGYNLPQLTITPEWVNVDYKRDGELFFTGLSGIKDRLDVRRVTLDSRIERAASIINDSSDQFIAWCKLNPEAEALSAALEPGSFVEVSGSDDAEEKAAAFEAFERGDIRTLITKAKIAGWGMNFQNSHRQIFVGLDDSWESYYQCIRRQYRFGQREKVDVRIVLSEVEDEIYRNIVRKEQEASVMSQKLIDAVRDYEQAELGASKSGKAQYRTEQTKGDGWTLKLGDSVDRLKELDDSSIDLSVFSPPFGEKLYVYSATERDLSNSRDQGEFMSHFGYIIQELYRVTKPGRICACHVMDIPATLVGDGYIGIHDFSGDVIREFEKHGWILDARVPIDKNQQAQSIRTHAKGLTFTQLEKDRTWSRPALPDYILKFRKPGENAIPVVGGVTRDEWIEWANPTWPNEDDRAREGGAFATWYDIPESDTLQGWMKARDHKDDLHVCPLQLGTIKRCILLWSNTGELVLDPFNGIGSTGDQAIRHGRQYIGIELKESYYKMALRNLRNAEVEARTLPMFDLGALQAESEEGAVS